MQYCRGGYDWNDLRYFLACARAGSLATAGRSLKVDQTTVGRRLAALEEALGARLFERRPEGFTLTPTAERLLETAQMVEQATIDLERRATGADARLEGVVRVATSETLSATFLAGELVALHQAHPEIELQLITGTTSLNLLKREADIALRVGQRPTHQSLIVRRLGAIAWGIFATKEYLGQHPPAESAARANASTATTSSCSMRSCRRSHRRAGSRSTRPARGSRCARTAFSRRRPRRAAGGPRGLADLLPRRLTRARARSPGAHHARRRVARRPPGPAVHGARPRRARSPRERDGACGRHDAAALITRLNGSAAA